MSEPPAMAFQFPPGTKRGCVYFFGRTIQFCEHIPNGECFVGAEGEWICLDCKGTGHGMQHNEVAHG